LFSFSFSFPLSCRHPGRHKDTDAKACITSHHIRPTKKNDKAKGKQRAY
jgi:hypothetical protein